MSVDINSDMTTPSNQYPGSSTPHPNPHPDPGHALLPPQRGRGGMWTAAAIVAVLLIAGIAYRLVGRSVDEHHLAKVTDANATPTVSVVHPTLSGAGSDLSLPGNTQAFDDTPIYARTSGYLKKWFVDIGAHVSKGQLMATIETPELDQQLQVAQANLESAQANLNLAKTTSERYQNLLKSDSVSKQETDVAVSGAAAHQSAVDAAEADVRRLQQMQGFENVYAPYSGVVTERNTDIGDLIDAGSPTSSNTAKELYRIASVNELRVFVSVPEDYAPDIHDGDHATLTLSEFPGQTFTGTVARNSGSIDMSSRTLNVEVDINNSNGKLLPGAYVFVHFNIAQTHQSLSIPSNTLLFRSEGLRVGVVQNGRVHLQPITIGKDNGKSVEISTGLNAQDEVILDPSDSISEGQQVQVSNQPAVQ